MKKLVFNDLDFDELLAIKAEVEAAIGSRIKLERDRLKASLDKLDAIAQVSTQAPGQKRARRSLPPKYRNPEDPNETWAGRGLKPRWLVAAMKRDKKKLSDFEIS